MDEVTFRIFPDQGALIRSLQGQQIDTAWFLGINAWEQYQDLPDYRIAVGQPPSHVEVLVFNLYGSTHHLLEDLTLRQAIQHGIATGSLIQQVWKGMAEPTCDDAPATFAHTTEALPCDSYAPESAAHLLDQDGWALGADGYRHKQGSVLELRYAYTEADVAAPPAAQFVRQQLKAIGIKVDLVASGVDALHHTILPSGAFDLAEYAIAPQEGDPANNRQWDCDQWPEAGGFNVMHWCDPAATQADQAARANPDQRVRKQQYQMLYTAIREQVPAIFLYTFPTITVARNTIRNYQPGPFGPTQTAEIWNWWRTDAHGIQQ